MAHKLGELIGRPLVKMLRNTGMVRPNLALWCKAHENRSPVITY